MSEEFDIVDTLEILAGVNERLAVGLAERLLEAPDRPYSPPPDDHLSMVMIARIVANTVVPGAALTHLDSCTTCQHQRDVWVSFLADAPESIPDRPARDDEPFSDDELDPAEVEAGMASLRARVQEFIARHRPKV